MSGTEMLVLMGALTIVFVLRSQRLGEICDAIREAMSNFRGGGPGSPSHPLPSADSALLNRRGKPRRDSGNAFPR